MPEIITDAWTYPLLLCAEALPLAALQHPIEPGHWRTCETVSIPSGDVSFVYDWRMAFVYRCVCNYELGIPATNQAVTTHDWEWLGAEAPAPVEFETVEAKFDAFFAAVKTALGKNVMLAGYRWSPWKNDFSGTEPSIRYVTRNVNIGNTVGGLTAPQVACAVTEETAIRRRWGRFYLPWPETSGISNGRFTSGICSQIGAAAVDLLETVESEWQHVTVSSLTPHILPTEYVRVDDVPDVIRSRRWASSTYRYRAAVT